MTDFAKSLFEDLTHPGSYGTPLLGWRNQTEIFRAPGAPPAGALPPTLPDTFIEKLCSI